MADTEVAVEEAQTQVGLRPMPAESLTVLALASLQAGDAETARKGLEAASQRGWREPISQLASAQSALEQGAYPVASQRIVALLSTGNLREPALGMLAELITIPRGREIMAARIAGPGRWQVSTITQAQKFVDPNDWAATLALASRKGATLPCAPLQLLQTRTEREGEAESAEVLTFVVERSC
ncbi:hypothetical protein D2V07_18280 [Aurantiacibacter zhengii]|uniref:Uncharacterized protein n=2 Tax=Aurantiacibacter zhengii TaxID=2307003 RepID=A0A418NMK4_9SPHN|nr:hypothetical protein D2V07_18280 [Aurantiacibacter zhengii]